MYTASDSGGRISNILSVVRLEMRPSDIWHRCVNMVIIKLWCWLPMPASCKASLDRPSPILKETKSQWVEYSLFGHSGTCCPRTTQIDDHLLTSHEGKFNSGSAHCTLHGNAPSCNSLMTCNLKVICIFSSSLKHACNSLCRAFEIFSIINKITDLSETPQL